MAKFMYLYKGPATPAEEMSQEDAQDVMTKWGEWIEKTGEALIDVGAPLDPAGASVIDDGSSATPDQLNGYSIVEAEDLAAATELAKDHPFLSDGTGEFSVEIFEMMPVPEM